MKIVIYQTSDVHGYIYPTNYLNPNGVGFLKIATFIEEDQKKYDASLKIENGDFIQGSAFANYLATKNNDSSDLLIQALNSLNFDVFILGNHEFNYGVAHLTKAYKQVENKILAANILGLPFKTKPYNIFDYQGFKIGVIGLTTKYIPNWEDAEKISGLTFLDVVDTYQKYEAELTQLCDLIIVSYHGGFEADFFETSVFKLSEENQAGALLKKFNSIDILLTGHQHQVIQQKIDDAIVSMPGVNGSYLTKIVIDTKTKKIEHELIDIAMYTLENHPNTEKIFHQSHQEFLLYLDKVIGQLDEDILIDDDFHARLYGHPFINLTHQIQQEISNADISVACLFDNSKGFSKNITVRDVLLNFPFPNTLKVLKMTGQQIKNVIEKSLTYFIIENENIAINPKFLYPKPLNYNYDLFYGLEYTVDLTKPEFQRIVKLEKDHEPFDLEKNYLVVLTNYRVNNKDIYPEYSMAEVVKEINIEINEIVLNYFLKHKKVTISKQKSIIIK